MLKLGWSECACGMRLYSSSSRDVGTYVRWVGTSVSVVGAAEVVGIAVGPDSDDGAGSGGPVSSFRDVGTSPRGAAAA